jgi:hypothetical protein
MLLLIFLPFTQCPRKFRPNITGSQRGNNLLRKFNKGRIFLTVALRKIIPFPQNLILIKNFQRVPTSFISENNKKPKIIYSLIKIRELVDSV